LKFSLVFHSFHEDINGRELIAPDVYIVCIKEENGFPGTKFHKKFTVTNYHNNAVINIMDCVYTGWSEGYKNVICIMKM
jgi:hypothetical protein